MKKGSISLANESAPLKSERAAVDWRPSGYNLSLKHSALHCVARHQPITEQPELINDYCVAKYNNIFISCKIWAKDTQWYIQQCLHCVKALIRWLIFPHAYFCSFTQKLTFCNDTLCYSTFSSPCLFHVHFYTRVQHPAYIGGRQTLRSDRSWSCTPSDSAVGCV